MTKAGFLIALAALLMMGCSKDKLVNDENDNNQLKKGSLAVTQKISFTSTSTGTEYSPLTEVGGKILRNGKFSGSLGGYGKINSSLSTYQFADPVSQPNLDDLTINFRECEYNYFLSFLGTAKIALGTRDYCTITITEGTNPVPYVNLYPIHYESGYSTNVSEFFGATFLGEAIISGGAGKLQALNGRKFDVYRGGSYDTINLSTGLVNLRFVEK